MSTAEVLSIFFHSLAEIHHGSRMGHFRIIHHQIHFTLMLKVVLCWCQQRLGDMFAVATAGCGNHGTVSPLHSFNGHLSTAVEAVHLLTTSQRFIQSMDTFQLLLRQFIFSQRRSAMRQSSRPPGPSVFAFLGGIHGPPDISMNWVCIAHYQRWIH